MKSLSSVLLATTVILSGCGGSGEEEKNQQPKPENPKPDEQNPTVNNTPSIKGQIKNKPVFNIPCDELDSSLLLESAKKNYDYAELQFMSRSTGIVFRIILPTKISLYKDTLGKYKVYGSEYAEADFSNRFLLNIKVPYGESASQGERYISDKSYDTNPYYTELVSIIEEEKNADQVTLLLKFKFNHSMIYLNKGVHQLNSELNNGELVLRVKVANK